MYSHQSRKDLGVSVDRIPCVSQVTLLCNIVAKAKQRSSQILRFFLIKDPEVLTTAFVVHVRPVLEYFSPAWLDSFHVIYINKLESVQRSFTKRLPGSISCYMKLV